MYFLVSHLFLEGTVSNTQLSVTNHNWYKLMETSPSTKCFLYRSVAEAVVTHKGICLLSNKFRKKTCYSMLKNSGLWNQCVGIIISCVVTLNTLQALTCLHSDVWHQIHLETHCTEITSKFLHNTLLPTKFKGSYQVNKLVYIKGELSP